MTESRREIRVEPGIQRLRLNRLTRARVLLIGCLLLLGATLVSAANAESDNGANTKDEKGDPPSAQQSPPPGVVVAAVQTQDVAAERRYIGTIKAIQSVDLRARVEGFLDEVAFKQGYTVEAGQLLYQIEQDQYQAALASAEGQLAASHAQLASAKATLEDKQADFERFAALVKKGDTSQTNFDRAKAQRDEASASVETAQASIKQAQAAIEQAKINLGYTSIVSPIAGRIGATKYTEGNLVDPSSGTLATVMQLDPIRAVFSIPSSDFVRLQERLADDGADHARDLFVPHLILPTGTYYKEKGQVAFADNQVNPQTGTIPIYADFPNPDRLLLPGQFVTAVVRSAETRKAPVVPASAIQRTREGERVYLVGPDNRVEQRKIETGVQIDSGYAVTSGLQSGEIVIVSGVQKVKPGMVVNPIKQSASGTRSAGVSSTSSDSKTDSGGEAGTAASNGSSSDSKADGSDGASSGSATTDVRQDAGQSNGSAGSGNASASSTASGSGEATDASPDAGSGSSANASTTRNDTNDSQ